MTAPLVFQVALRETLLWVFDQLPPGKELNKIWSIIYNLLRKHKQHKMEFITTSTITIYQQILAYCRYHIICQLMSNS